jgi:hypothetical protein
MPTGYSATYDTETATSLGVDKANKEPVIDSTLDSDALEHNTIKGGVRQLQLTLGKDPAGVLTVDGDADEGNVREYLEYMMPRADKAGFFEHFLEDSTVLAFCGGVTSTHIIGVAGGAGAAFATVSGGIGVSATTLGAAAAAGLESTDAHFHQRSTYYRCRWQISALSATNGDYIYVGIRRDATHYVLFKSTRAGGAWPDWTVEVNDGGATDSAVLTGSNPSDAVGTWVNMEIFTDATGAYFYVDRKLATEYSDHLTGQAPENGQCDPVIVAISNAGGEVLRVDLVACADTRVL